MNNDVIFHVAEGIATICLNRPAKLNALTLDMLDEIDKAIAAIERDPSVKVVVVRSSSSRFFCSGADIKEWGDLDPGKMGTHWIRAGNRVFRRLCELDQPTIAVLSGSALGGGLELALACDLRYAATTIKLGFPEASVGAIPGWMGGARLAETIGLGRAREMILTGEAIDATTAQQWGAVNDVVAQEELHARVTHVCAVLSTRSRTSLSVAKRLLRMCETGQLDIAHELAASVCKSSDDAAEGVQAFREKRVAHFR